VKRHLHASKPIFRGERIDSARDHPICAVDKYIQTPVVPRNTFQSIAKVIRPAHIETQGLSPPSPALDPGGHCLRSRLIDIRHEYQGTFTREALCRCGANSRRGTRDKGRLPNQSISQNPHPP